MTTAELSVSFLRAPTIRSQTIIGRGRVIHASRSLGPRGGDPRGRARSPPRPLLLAVRLLPLNSEMLAARGLLRWGRDR